MQARTQAFPEFLCVHDDLDKNRANIRYDKGMLSVIFRLAEPTRSETVSGNVKQSTSVQLVLSETSVLSAPDMQVKAAEGSLSRVAIYRWLQFKGENRPCLEARTELTKMITGGDFSGRQVMLCYCLPRKHEIAHFSKVIRNICLEQHVQVSVENRPLTLYAMSLTTAVKFMYMVLLLFVFLSKH
jgi:hypothetical protein